MQLQPFRLGVGPADPRKARSRAAAHGDINTITLLLGAEEAGLELLTKQGEWLPIPAAEGALVINVGDMLERQTNGQLRSTTHRVVNPRGMRRGDHAIRCRSSCISGPIS